MKMGPSSESSQMVAATWLVLVLATQAEAEVTPRGLRCEYLNHPLGIDEAHPRLSWALEPVSEGSLARRGIVQLAYRILVASSPDQLAKNHGDSGIAGK